MSKKLDYLTLCSIAAQEAGMSYGKYMAKYGWNPPIMRQQQEEPEGQEDGMIVCPECGKQFYKTNHSRVYCSYECYKIFNDREAKRRYRARKAMAHE